jgi:exopolyphosphatase/guanosine-5'-triphosphate,3'-diphosphate pyrophosphatase
MKLAGIDIGTNTLRLLIAEFSEDGIYRKVDSGRYITRLGEGLSGTGRLKDEAMERALRVLKGFADKCSENDVDGIYAVATSAVREAVNGRDFIQEVKNKTGIDVNIISGDEEARITMLGVYPGLEITGKDVLMMDIGGGSTEFMLVSKGGEIIFTVSTDIGVVRFTEQYIKSDPPGEQELELLGKAIEDRLKKVASGKGDLASGVEFIGTAGTVTTLAAIDQMMRIYDPEKINGYRIKRDGVMKILKMIRGMTNKDRKELPGVEEGREDIILAGAMVVYKVMELFGFDEMTVSDAGLREGLVTDLYKRLK